jgi:hypothetical protein
MMCSLDQFREPFKSIVLHHVQDGLDPSEWRRLRSLARTGRRFMACDVDMNADPSTLFDGMCSEDLLSLNEVLGPALREHAVEIGRIEQEAVYYVSGRGIYVWGLEPQGGNTLGFWVTSPAYPPGW